ncbi:hypothetical protein Q9L58_006271 [Maublancomyces gigas]|uniref:Uncharacterized protein n=1 Tax=Discina gigas TaxID=1032678 RepID=A0ABR3GFN5_9PEZI
MQYGKVFSALIVGVLAGIQACNAQTYSLYADTSENLNTVYRTVSWVNSADGGAFIGNVKLQQSAELLTESSLLDSRCGNQSLLARYQQEDHWAICPSATYTSSYKIFYVGGGNAVPADCVAVKLKAQEYGVCSVPK